LRITDAGALPGKPAARPGSVVIRVGELSDH
jgi:hypothetical protein